MTPLPAALRSALDRFKADQAGDMTDDDAILLALRELLVTLGYLDVVGFRRGNGDERERMRGEMRLPPANARVYRC